MACHNYTFIYLFNVDIYTSTVHINTTVYYIYTRFKPYTYKS